MRMQEAVKTTSIFRHSYIVNKVTLHRDHAFVLIANQLTISSSDIKRFVFHFYAI